MSDFLSGLPIVRALKTKRASSWDRRGGNRDRICLVPDESATLLDVSGAGRITHIWMTSACREPDHLRKVVIKAYWDGESEPSVLAPLGDFFGVGHGRSAELVSLPLVMAPEGGHGMNCYFPMPYSRGARLEVSCETLTHEVLLYYYIDYEECEGASLTSLYPGADEHAVARFHVQWRRENPTDGTDDDGMTGHTLNHGGINLDGKGNYVILDAEGAGHYVGCHLDIENLRYPTVPATTYRESNWFGEGDDMIFIDGEKWPPSLHGTGTEDYFNLAWGAHTPFSSPFFGMPISDESARRYSLYRFHLLDPVRFTKQIRVTIEHGHANRRSDDFSSTAYWYQTEPHKPFGILPMIERLPRPGGGEEHSPAPNA